ncbi:hypothetical protein [Actinoplanes sp. TFC3]|uniref:hypothetical protein n=1 Tax=Actinoplanes sp. TFC3 TaxID=1710355 RepID=UPI00082BAC6D|nr:hypothetical protein [Actinoplanes sp. TFC3]
MDLDAAITFIGTHARLLERRRLDSSPEGAVAALDAYRNPDGGYGWGLEPDCRTTTSQPVAAMHALEVLASLPALHSSRATEICDWLARHSRPDGGVPFGLPYADTAGSAGHWVNADPTTSSLQMTAQLAAQAHRIPAVREHPWLAGATAYCLTAIEGLDETAHAYELMFVMRFLDAVAERSSQAATLLTRVAGLVNTDGPTPVTGGAQGEELHPLDFSPRPDAPSRKLLSPSAIKADVARLAAQQQDDGGWTVDYPIFSPAAALEWRGYATLQNLLILQAA